MIKEEKIYRVAIEAEWGLYNEQFFRTKTFAELNFDRLLGEMRDKDNTLNDDTFSMEGFGNKNFEEWHKEDGILRKVAYGFGKEVEDENGREVYTYCHFIILEEIKINVGEIVRVK